MSMRHFFLTLLVGMGSEMSAQEHLLDTTNDQSGGNWFIKRELATKARTLYGKLKTSIDAIGDQANYFIDARLTTTIALDAFYTAIEFKHDELETAVRKSLKKIEGELEGKDTPEDRDEFIQLTEQQEQLKDLVSKIALLVQGDQNMQRAVKSSADVIVIAQSYRERALEHIKEIDDTLDHIKARYLYDQIQSYLDHVEQLTVYLTSNLKNYADETSSKLTAEMTELKAKIAQLQDKDILSKPEKELKKTALKAEQSSIPVPESFWSRMMGWIAYPFVTVYRWFTSLFFS